jgi:hypothetical protein
MKDESATHPVPDRVTGKARPGEERPGHNQPGTDAAGIKEHVQ